MNSYRSLQDHAYSGAHIKSVEFSSRKSTSKGKYSRYNRDSLEYKLDTSKGIGLTVGLERVEGFVGKKGRRYYKCTLCSAHGNVEAMFRHLVGDKHTDKFIKSRLVLKNSTITADERTVLRKMLLNKEDYGVHNIKTISESELYPYVWEAEGKYSKSKKTEKLHICEENIGLQQEQHSEKEITSETTSSIKSKSAEDDFNYLIDRFKFIVATHGLEETRFERPEDLRTALIIMIFALLWLYATIRNIRDCYKNHHDHYVQHKILQSCMGYVINQIGDTFNFKYPDLAVALRVEKPTPAMIGRTAKRTSVNQSQCAEVITLEDLD